MLDRAVQDGANRTPVVQLDGIHKSFGLLEVLKGVSLTAHEGDVIALIGASGSGKSTLLRCTNLLEVPNSGRILIGNEEIRLRKATDGSMHVADQKQLQRIRSRLYREPIKVSRISATPIGHRSGSLSPMDVGLAKGACQAFRNGMLDRRPSANWSAPA